MCAACSVWGRAGSRQERTPPFRLPIEAKPGRGSWEVLTVPSASAAGGAPSCETASLSPLPRHPGRTREGKLGNDANNLGCRKGAEQRHLHSVPMDRTEPRNTPSRTGHPPKYTQHTTFVVLLRFANATYFNKHCLYSYSKRVYILGDTLNIWATDFRKRSQNIHWRKGTSLP